jgi:hypothetical protein
MIGITTIKTNTVMNYDLIPRNYVVIEDWKDVNEELAAVCHS